MQIADLPRKIRKGLPYLGKELRSIVSDHTPFFIAVPRTVHIWRGAPCNAKCIMCEFGFKTGEALRQMSTSPFTDEMLLRVLPQIHELCGRGTLVSYMGGEATVSKHIVDWVRTAGSHGLDFRFTTNGYRMDQKMASELVAAGMFNIGVSLEAVNPAVNEIMRPYPDGTKKTINAIELILSERQRQKRFISVNIKTVISRVNMDDFFDIVKRWGKTDGVMCTPQPFEQGDGMPQATRDLLYHDDIGRLERWTDRVREMKREGYNIHVSEQHLREFVKQVRDDKDRKAECHKKDLQMDPSEPLCNIGTDNMWIESGYVKLCPYHKPIGEVISGTRTLKEMWDSEITRQVRAQTRACRRLCTLSCLRRSPLKHKINTFLRIA
jgi:sulfatase maturation enzyme AslB (radical SAM superfamily)